MPLPALLNALELADRLGVSDATVKSWARSGQLPTVPDERGRHLFSWPAVVREMRKHNKTPFRPEEVMK